MSNSSGDKCNHLHGIGQGGEGKLMCINVRFNPFGH